MNRKWVCALAPLICASAVLVSGCREKAETKKESNGPSDAKAQIFKYLARKAQQKQFTPGIDLELPKHVAVFRSNALAWEQRAAALRTSLQALNNGSPAPESERGSRDDKRASLERELKEAERQWETARSDAGGKQEELSHQEDTYIRAMRQKIAEARSYELLYRLVGEQLTTADRLLAEPVPARRRMGLKLAREACNHAKSAGADVWLAARICEAYFWPNLDMADPQPGSRDRLELLETARRIFFETDETNSVLKNYSLLMSNAPNAHAADTFRVQLADWLEEKRNVKFAAQILNEISNAEVLASAQERITRVREAAAATP